MLRGFVVVLLVKGCPLKFFDMLEKTFTKTCCTSPNGSMLRFLEATVSSEIEAKSPQAAEQCLEWCRVKAQWELREREGGRARESASCWGLLNLGIRSLVSALLSRLAN